MVKIKGEILDANEKENKLDFNVRIITQSKIDPERFYIGRNTVGVTVIEYNSGKWRRVITYKSGQGSVTGISEVENGDLIFSTDFGNNIFRVPFNDTIPVLYGTEKGVPDSPVKAISEIGNEIIITTGKGLYKYVKTNDSWIPCDEMTGGYSAGKESFVLLRDQDSDLWVAFKDPARYSEMMFSGYGNKTVSYYGPMAVLPNVRMMDIKNFDKKIWMTKSNSVFVIDKKKLLEKAPSISPLINKIVIGRDSVLTDGSFTDRGAWGKRIPAKKWIGNKIPELKYIFNSISFFWTTPYFINEESTTYNYKLDGFDRDWSGWGQIFYKDYTNLPYGHYFFRVKAKTATEIVTDEAIYEFIILKPWYLTTTMIFLYAVALIFIILAIIKSYTRKLKNENIRLEGIVAERTSVVVKQKEELESSIYYARRIQMALLPSEAILSDNIKNYFVLFKPRDIVSGDFYWMTKKGERLYIVASDCTGHGVPGAFMSLLGMSFLDEIIDKEFAPRADIVLNQLRLHVIESLKQVGDVDEAKDGMDIALLVIDFNKQRIEFSGAYNPCFMVRKLSEEESERYNKESIELPNGSMSDGKYMLETIFGSKMPIGISSRMKEDFVFYDSPLEKGISFYLFSDGYIDQFGGPDGRKFMKKNFKRFLISIQEYPMDRQKELLEKNLHDWMGQNPQVDDILVMGIRTE